MPWDRRPDSSYSRSGQLRIGGGCPQAAVSAGHVTTAMSASAVLARPATSRCSLAPAQHAIRVSGVPSPPGPDGRSSAPLVPPTRFVYSSIGVAPRGCGWAHKRPRVQGTPQVGRCPYGDSVRHTNVSVQLRAGAGHKPELRGRATSPGIADLSRSTHDQGSYVPATSGRDSFGQPGVPRASRGHLELVQYPGAVCPQVGHEWP